MRVREFMDILMRNEDFPVRHYYDMRELVKRLGVRGTSVNEEEIFELRASLQTIVALKRFFSGEREARYPTLSQLTEYVYFPELLIREAAKISDDKGKIRDSASEELSKIRREMRRLISGNRNKVYAILSEAKRKGWTREDAEVTVRNGRVVIPVLANYKRSIKGFIHDESASGQTSFIEPLELFESNNRIKELEFEEKNEIKRILLDYSELLRPELESLASAYHFLALVDFIRAKARFALEHGAVIPNVGDTPQINWKRAYHPLLLMLHKRKGKDVVPLDMEINEEKRVLIVSGPNAGGKSVLLKTVALNQYMLQCGFPVFMREISEAGIFKNFFIDIGDEQSIENDLSTYSSHLKNIKHFVENADDSTLVLIDEFGTGTEPEFGGAIAAAALETLYEKGAYALITTHYSQLKMLPADKSAMVNGAMMFDTDRLTPLYKFKEGKPGSSFAFEIAANTGLQEEVLERATQMVGREKIDFDRQLQELENEKDEVERKLKDFESADKVLAETIEKYNSLYRDIKLREKEIIYEAKRQAKEIMAGANKAIEKAVSEIKSKKLEKKELKEIRHKIEAKKSELTRDTERLEQDIENRKADKPTDEKKKTFKELKGKPQTGDYVIIKGQNSAGTVESIKRNNAIVNFDSVKVVVKTDRLQRIEKPVENRREKPASHKNIMKDIHKRAAEFSPFLDLRGIRGEEALEKTRKWIDEAILTGNKDLEVLHGKGDGILRSIIRRYLSGVQQVESFRDAPLEFGGSGKTLIKLR